jgi:hypothetical protein
MCHQDGDLKLNKLIAICISILLVGCRAEFEDVSNKEEYKNFIGAKYSLVQEMYISGVNLSPGYSDIIHIYKVGRTKPSWSGPELISRDTLLVNTIMQIESVRECSNCPFDHRVQVVITVTPYEKAINVPVAMDIKYITEYLSEYVQKVK